jgi:hypothetical protein
LPSNHLEICQSLWREDCFLLATGKRSTTRSELAPMQDLIVVLATVGFFVVSWAYVRGCDAI